MKIKIHLQKPLRTSTYDRPTTTSRKKERKRERERHTHFLSNSFHFSVIIFSGTIQREREREREREWRNDRRLGGIGGDEVRAMAVMVIVFDTKASEEATHSSGNRSVKKPHH